MKNHLFATVVCVALIGAVPGVAEVVYSSLPSPLPPNTVSLGYEADGLSSFGDLVQFGDGTGYYGLDSITIAMSNWAYQSEWPGVGTSVGFTLPLTVDLYNVGAGDTLGSLISTQTVNALIPWRPEPDPADCAPGNNNDYLGSDSTCYAGALSLVNVNLGVITPGQIIYDVAFNTTDSGASPTNVPGPYDSLNFGVTTSAPGTGSNPDSGYEDSGQYYSAQGYPYIGEVEIDGELAPEPASFLLAALGLVCLAVSRKRRA